MSSAVDVSIVVIAFEEEAVIAECLAAISDQATTRAMEILVVDDGSTDETPARVAEAARRDPRVRLLAHERNRGRGAARRTGQDAAAAPLIGYVDADVVIPRDWLERCAAALGSNGAVSGVATPDGDCVVLARLVHPVARVRPHTMAISGGNVLFDASVLREVGFDEHARLGEDFRLARRLASLGHPIETVPGLVVEHREAKSYGATLRWMWQNGVDAARLPFEFGVVRVPDLTWLAWLGVLVGAPVLAGAGVIAWGPAVAAVVLGTGAVAVGHAATRFKLRPRTLRWIAAAVLDVPLVTAYLAGRTVGLPAAVASLRRAPASRSTTLATAAPAHEG